jgi:hypothetical protein
MKPYNGQYAEKERNGQYMMKNYLRKLQWNAPELNVTVLWI